MLTDSEIKKLVKDEKISIQPFNEAKVKAGKYNVHLGQYLLKPIPTDTILDPTDTSTTPEYEKIDLVTNTFVLRPKEFVLGQTLEFIGLSADIGMFIDGATTLARLGLSIHQSATFINPGQDPHIITLELYNAGPWKIKLTYKMRIGRLLVFKYNSANEICAKDYNRYNGQKETTGAIFKEQPLVTESII